MTDEQALKLHNAGFGNRSFQVTDGKAGEKTLEFGTPSTTELLERCGKPIMLRGLPNGEYHASRMLLPPNETLTGIGNDPDEALVNFWLKAFGI